MSQDVESNLVQEYLETLHRRSGNLKVLFGSRVHSQIIEQATNWSNLDIHVISAITGNENNFEYESTLNQLQSRVTFQSSLTTLPLFNWDLIILTERELNALSIDFILTCINLTELMISDSLDSDSYDAQLGRRGFIQVCDHPLVYKWKNKTDWGTWLLSQQNFLKAVSAFQRVLKDNPGDVTALTQLGLLSVKIEDYQEAESLFKQALRHSRRDCFLIEQLAKVLVELNQFQEATDILEHLVTIQPLNTLVWLLLERCYRQQGKAEKANLAYQYSVNLRSNKTKVDVSIGLGEKPVAKIPPKRILIINNLYPPQELGGYGRRICDFGNVLRKRGHHIYILTSDAPYLGVIKSEENNITRNLLLCGTYEQLPPKPFEEQTKIAEIIQHNDRVIQAAINYFEPDFCLVGNIDFLSNTVFQPFFARAIPVIHLLGFEKPGYAVEYTPDTPLYWVGANSKYGQQKVLSKGYPLNDIGVVYPGVFLRQFQMCCLPSFDKLRIVFASLVLPYKGPQVLLEALAILHQNNIDFHCSIAGDAPNSDFFQSLKLYAQQQEIENQVDFCGYLSRTQLIDLFATHNVLVFPSVWEEPFGRSQVEAMAAGLTLITSGTGGSGEVIEPGVSGLQFSAGNAQALAETLMNLVNNPQRWEQITIAGQQQAKQFDIDRSIDLIEEKFDELLKIRDGNEALVKQKLTVELFKKYRLQTNNFIAFPDWTQDEESLGSDLAEVIKSVITHPDSSRMTLLIDNSNISDEEADLGLSSIVMNLIMEEELEVADEPNIVLIGQLSEIQWSALIPHLQGRIVLEHENQDAIKQSQAENIPTVEV
ncbi:glycosyltransferase [Capilliphycus salinus ALCB114379]|uniref:glycosyltransferase n=1 Tax=Capilliphycus salinus TaxID=2768948 RepID=UPI0039A78407